MPVAACGSDRPKKEPDLIQLINDSQKFIIPIVAPKFNEFSFVFSIGDAVHEFKRTETLVKENFANLLIEIGFPHISFLFFKKLD
jgi:hypothetical protein